jgi:hypothetical protein
MPLKESPSSILEIHSGGGVVVLRETETSRLAPMGSDRSVVSAGAEFPTTADTFDIVIEVPQMVDRRLLDVLVGENPTSQ